jgi:hypothetical protein
MCARRDNGDLRLERTRGDALGASYTFSRVVLDYCPRALGAARDFSLASRPARPLSTSKIPQEGVRAARRANMRRCVASKGLARPPMLADRSRLPPQPQEQSHGQATQPLQQGNGLDRIQPPQSPYHSGSVRWFGRGPRRYRNPLTRRAASAAVLICAACVFSSPLGIGIIAMGWLAGRLWPQ